MGDYLKNKSVLILGIVAALLFLGNISSCSNAGKQKQARDKEMATRLDLEEKMSKFTQEKTTLEAKITALTQELETENTADQATKKALLQEQLISQSLKDEVQKVIKLKEALEGELKDVLAKGKSSKLKK